MDMEQARQRLLNQQRNAVLETLVLTHAAAGLALKALDVAMDCSRRSNVSPTRKQEGLAEEALGIAADTLDSTAGVLKALNKSLNPV